MKVAPRSILFVPGDSERKLARAAESGADALVVDLEDSVAPGRKAAAREMAADYLARTRGPDAPALWVRINAGRHDALADLGAVMPARPAGILLPKTEGGADVTRVAHWLDGLEAGCGLPDGSTRIMAVATETATATFALSGYRGSGEGRLAGLTWGAEDLSADLGATDTRDADGALSLTYRMLRSQLLLAARHAGVWALDTPHPDFRDLETLRRTLAAARRDGFDGGFAIHPAQVEPLNDAFTPGDEEIAQAERVVAAFAAEPDAGTLGIEGRMYDRPHLLRARKVLARRDAIAARRR